MADDPAPDPVQSLRAVQAASGLDLDGTPLYPEKLYDKYGTHSRLPEGQPASLLIPLEDDWVSPTGDPSLRGEDLPLVEPPASSWAQQFLPVVHPDPTPAQTGWLPPLLRRMTGGAS